MLILPYGIKFAFYVLFQAIAVYFNLYYLIPRFLELRLQLSGPMITKQLQPSTIYK